MGSQRVKEAVSWERLNKSGPFFNKCVKLTRMVNLVLAGMVRGFNSLIVTAGADSGAADSHIRLSA